MRSGQRARGGVQHQTRRRRISAIHNEIRKLIKPSEYVFLIEDDSVLPADALSRLLADYQGAHMRASSRAWSSGGGGYLTSARGGVTTCTT